MSLGIDLCTDSVSVVLELTLAFLMDIALGTLIKGRATPTTKLACTFRS